MTSLSMALNPNLCLKLVSLILDLIDEVCSDACMATPLNISYEVEAQ